MMTNDKNMDAMFAGDDLFNSTEEKDSPFGSSGVSGDDDDALSALDAMIGVDSCHEDTGALESVNDDMDEDDCKHDQHDAQQSALLPVEDLMQSDDNADFFKEKEIKESSEELSPFDNAPKTDDREKGGNPFDDVLDSMLVEDCKQKSTGGAGLDANPFCSDLFAEKNVTTAALDDSNPFADEVYKQSAQKEDDGNPFATIAPSESDNDPYSSLSQMTNPDDDDNPFADNNMNVSAGCKEHKKDDDNIDDFFNSLY